MDIQTDFTPNTPTQDPFVTYPHELHRPFDHQSAEVPPKFQALRVHFRASRSLPIPDLKTGYLWACAPNAIAQISVGSLLLTQEAYQSKSLPPSPSTAGSPGILLVPEQPALDTTEGLEFTPPSTAEAVPPRLATPPLSVHHPHLDTSGGSHARLSPYPACLVVDAARKYRLLGAQCLHILIRWLLVDYDNKPPARLFSEIAGQLASREVAEFKRDLRRTIHTVFLSVWDANNVST
ncbi:hypothetical protein FIBSPDRAFT_865038 [Athelia psychrophila]|uniref:Uncharacterized protein n=1 Tax=Athelia psychrophila TaxID=1759441 RepID=A0A166G1E1_9AGAM|nr:hypothetical protein FIBSPDRAFT_865038 [Fibularhizoctonia sp. CBS 109695]